MEINNNNDIIKTFIKIEYPELKKDNIYEVDENNQNIKLNNSDKDVECNGFFYFKYDKIFTNNDSNSYIYEEICMNCVKESFEGNSFCFISYGETISNKFDLMYGKIKKDYSNINNHGLFLRLLNNILKKKKESNKDINIKISHFLVNENNLIDLSLYRKEKIENINFNDFLNNSLKIDNDIDILDKIKKISFHNDINKDMNKTILFLNKIIKLLLTLEEQGNNNIYTLSHLCSIIYLKDKTNKILSTITFIILNGCEHLYFFQNYKKKIDIKVNSPNETNQNELIKQALNLQFTFDNIINSINNIKYINDKLTNINELYGNISENNEKKLKEEEENYSTNILSKIVLVFYKICFGKNVQNIKFRIVGSIKPIIGFLKASRDTLLFVSNITKKWKNNKNNLKKYDNSLIERNENILDLNFKLDLQKKQIENMNNIILKKEEKILFLTNTYRKQIDVLKKYFDFKGDINILLSGDLNTEEAMYTKDLKNMKMTIQRQESKINFLEKQLEISNKDITKYKNLSKIKENDTTMLNYYLSIQSIKDNQNQINKDTNHLINGLNHEIVDLKQIIDKKDKIIEVLQKDLQKKTNIICNLPKSNQTSNKKCKEKNKKILKSVIENQIELDDNEILRKEIDKLKENEEMLKSKFKLIIVENKNQIYNLEHKLEKIEETYKNKINILNKEIVRLYEMLLYIITFYQRIFSKEAYFEKENLEIFNNKKEDFDQIIANIDRNINEFNFFSLHSELKRLNKTKDSIIKNFKFDKNDDYITKEIMGEDYTEIYKQKDDVNEPRIMTERSDIITELNNKIKKMTFYLDEQIKLNTSHNLIINSQKRTIEKIKQESFIYNNLIKNKVEKRNHCNTPLSHILRKNHSKLNLNFSPIKTRRVIDDYNDYNSFINSDKTNKTNKYILNISKIFNKNESTKSMSFQQQSPVNNNIDGRTSSPTNSLVTTNTNNKTNTTNSIYTQKKVVNSQKYKRPFSSHYKRK